MIPCDIRGRDTGCLRSKVRAVDHQSALGFLFLVCPVEYPALLHTVSAYFPLVKMPPTICNLFTPRITVMLNEMKEKQ